MTVYQTDPDSIHIGISCPLPTSIHPHDHHDPILDTPKPSAALFANAFGPAPPPGRLRMLGNLPGEAFLFEWSVNISTENHSAMGILWKPPSDSEWFSVADQSLISGGIFLREIFGSFTGFCQQTCASAIPDGWFSGIIYTLQQTHIAMENGPFIVDLPLKSGDYNNYASFTNGWAEEFPLPEFLNMNR